MLDTNVVMSGVFFGGTPGKALSLWSSGRFDLVVSLKILDEYRRVASELGSRFPDMETTTILDLITVHAEIVEDQSVPGPLCRDKDDDMFLVCAAASGAVLVSGDKDLLAADGMLGVRVLTPRCFTLLFPR